MYGYLWAVGLGTVLFTGVLTYAMTRRYGWGAALAFPLLAVLVVIAATLWAWTRSWSGARSAALVLLVLALFVATRLPSGNVFDAVIDPWLWFALQIAAVRNWRAGRKARGV